MLKITNLLKLYTLLALSERPKHGYELIKELHAKLSRPISPSQMYPFLNELERKGLLAFQESGAREKKTYALTAKGKAFTNGILSKLGTMLTAAHQLVKCTHCSCEIYGKVHQKKVRGKSMPFCCMHCAKAYGGG